MNRTMAFLSAAMCTVSFSGCMPSDAEIAAMLKQPPRPPELDRLSAFEGTWSGTCDTKIKGMSEAKKLNAASTARWAADGWVLVEEWRQGISPEEMAEGVSMMWWDQRSGKYLVRWADNYGSHGEGTMSLRGNNTWVAEGKTIDGQTGEVTIGQGTWNFTNPNTMEWTWTEWDKLKMIKYVDARGVSHRQ